MRTIVIDRQYNGPETRGNGGYVAGLVAAGIDGPAEVVLRAGVPLGRPLSLVSDDGESLDLREGSRTIAVAQPAAGFPVAPQPPPILDVTEANLGVDFDDHPFPACFVCGPEREPGDGMRIFPVAIPGRPGIVASDWWPHDALSDGAGRVRPEFVWAALDCPGGWAAIGDDPRPILLGTMAASIEGNVLVGEPHIVVGWEIGRSGRKVEAGTAIFTVDGTRVAVARATWILAERETVLLAA